MKAPNIDIYDTTVAVWEEHGDEASFRERVFLPAVACLRGRGWHVIEDPEIVAHYRVLRRYHRIGNEGELGVKLEMAGRHFEAKFWQFSSAHKHGGRYDFDRRENMTPLVRRRCDLEMAKLVERFRERLGYPVQDRRYLGETADQRIARDYAESWHTVPELGRPRFTNGDRDRRSADGALLEHGQTVWFYSDKGPLFRSRAFYRLNNMWWVRINARELTVRPNYQLFARQPRDLHAKNPAIRERRIRALIEEAVQREDFLRAHMLKTVREAAAEPPAHAVTTEAA